MSLTTLPIDTAAAISPVTATTETVATEKDDTIKTVETTIIGAGFAGLGMGALLRRSGQHDFAILERAGEVGGTWRDNVYPGVACDIPSELYSYSFRQPYSWSRYFAPGDEILDYLRRTAQEENLLPHIRLNDALNGAVWDSAQGCWHLSTSREQLTTRTLVLAAGRLSEPFLPVIPGQESFPGPAFHSARWEDHPLEGLRVGVVGTGASALQIVPQLVHKVSQLVVFQRSAPWVLPRHDHAWKPNEQRPGREELFTEAEQLFDARRAGIALDKLRERAKLHRLSSLSDPALQEATEPDYEIGCKRALFSDDWYPALMHPHLTLETSALAGIEAETALAASGKKYPLDVLIFATGFITTRPPFARLIRGVSGKTLDEHWVRGMTSYASTVVNDFPNLFVLDGPNASLGHNSAIEIIESQISYVMGALDWLRSHPEQALEVDASAEREYTALIDRLAEGTVWASGCRSWYRDERSGRLTLLWPATATAFRERNARFDPAPFHDASSFQRTRQ